MSRSIAVSAVAVAIMLLTHGDAVSGMSTFPLVEHGDLNLDDPRDARVMLERLRKAAVRACGYDPRFDPDFGGASTEATRRFTKCVSITLNDAVKELNVPTVSRIFAQEVTGAASHLERH